MRDYNKGLHVWVPINGEQHGTSVSQKLWLKIYQTYSFSHNSKLGSISLSLLPGNIFACWLIQSRLKKIRGGFLLKLESKDPAHVVFPKYGQNLSPGKVSHDTFQAKSTAGNISFQSHGINVYVTSCGLFFFWKSGTSSSILW